MEACTINIGALKIKKSILATIKECPLESRGHDFNLFNYLDDHEGIG
jgi:hypothetical protein|tara:strand:- start:95 stop:235 length:141 start_codon:yes stop_codon:yes gene_type:complete